MSIHVALSHVTEYSYDRLIALGPQVVRLRPAPHSRTRILSYSLRIEPANHFLNWQQDPQGNYQARLVFQEKTRHFRIAVDLVAEMAVFNPFDFFLTPAAEEYPFTYTPEDRIELAACRVKPVQTPRLAAYVASLPLGPMRTIDFLVAVNASVAAYVGYVIRMEPGVQTPEQTLTLRTGSCRDSARLLVAVLRSCGLAARFVSGYLIQLKADTRSLDGPAGPEKDFTDLHAWCEVYLPGAGWIGLDPTSGLLAGEGHIPLACAPDSPSAAPLSGALDECEVEFLHEMSVTRVWEAPRVTKPYAEDQWQHIVNLGKAVDARIAAADLRLTMGGEPTFVAVDDPDGAEWNTTAMGPTKRHRAAELYHLLKSKYAPNGLMHFGQGKWYPGEQLPRWSLNCFWRRDGEPVWNDPQLLADESVDYGASAADAAALLRLVAQRLGVSDNNVFSAFEDAFYYLWRERQLPGNVDPHDSRLEDPLERKRLRHVFDQGLAAAVGHVLPLARNEQDTNWESGSWFLRDERCYLVPGDSAMGYRLPLDSQPWVAKDDYPYVHQPDPSQAFPPLAARAVLQQQPNRLARASQIEPSAGKSAADVTRTALSAESRDGVLYVFMPPLASLEAYLELTTVVEDSVAELGLKVVLEGYEPPRDPRLSNFRVTPDPGVIEVNIHPAQSWDELVERTEHLYEAARNTRLTAEKFMLDGRHTGTGGGNHFVMGASTPNDSLFLRRPDVLRSLISYWHNHPSLSYLFSGLFIGPTSQAPRVDEARSDSVYELELALSELTRTGEYVPPWQVDRALRNLLIDATGNTHRAEFCIDKLYSPDGPAGRLGLVELRAFEMPPNARMSLAQQLLLRSLLVRFAETPYHPQRLARWGTGLHDRFMLPYFVRQDFSDVLAELRADGIDIEDAWFAPHFEFRFPRYGDYETRGVAMEIRHALEPWNVLGEEGSAAGTVRYVDSSVERVQVKVSGLAPDRYAVTCNGRAVPLRPTGTAGEYVAGVRYKAWQPASALHPAIGVNSPLTFDLVDRWMERSMGGCQYHVAHPGGRGYEIFPVNAFEAESRRLSRFFRLGHTQGRIAVPDPVASPDMPFTLDLRWARG